MLEVAISGRRGSFQYTYECTHGPGIGAIWGRSGAGKTTLLKLVAGLLEPDFGRISFGGREWWGVNANSLPARLRQTGYVPQHGAIFHHMTVAENLDYAVKHGGRKPRADRNEIIELLGLEKLLERYPAGLSGGERQRLALGRAMLADPRMLILDEPFSGLDEQRIVEISSHIRQLTAHYGLPVLLVTHAARDIQRLADRLIVVEEGQVIQQGVPREIFARMGLSFPDVREGS